MNDLQRFLATMRYEPKDRGMICDFGFWDETLPTWHEQGLPEEIDSAKSGWYFGMDTYDTRPPLSTGLRPGFEWQVVEDRGDHEVVRDWEGVLVLRKKFMGSIPIHLGHTLVDRESWRREFVPRLDPNDPARFPTDWDAWVARTNDPDRDWVSVFNGPSLYGWIRNWMGVENVSLAVYDDPAWFEDMVEAVCRVSERVIEKALADGAKFEACALWEDMCYSGGPLLSPMHFREFLVPRYRRIVEPLKQAGCEVFWVDCDGRIDSLVPLWLEAGVNTMFPIEVGTWGADPVAFRKEYGRDLLLMGGFDKNILKSGPDAIDAEIERLAPLVEEGGFIPFCDHRVPPDVPYTHYLHYLRRVREVWGKNTNLKPFHPDLETA